MKTLEKLKSTPYSKETSTPTNLITAAVLSAALTLTGCQNNDHTESIDNNSQDTLNLEGLEISDAANTQKCIEDYGKDDCPEI